MTDFDLSIGADALELRWPGGRSAIYPFIWLRDNCASGFHPETFERTFDLLSIPENPRVRAARLGEGGLVVEWEGEEHVSRFSLDWLAANRPGEPRGDPAAVTAATWRANLGTGGIPRHAAERIMADDRALAAWMADTARYGLSIVEGVESRPEVGVAIAERIGFLRRTNFGTTFEVVNKPDPNNLAFTCERLPLHTDLANQEVPPGYQFLHCIANEAEGGGSIFADGFAIAEDLRAEEPEHFRLLAEVPIPFRFHDRETDIRVREPVVTLHRDGSLREIRYNAHLAGVFDMAPDIMPAYYRAYRAFMARTRRADYFVTLKLQGGEMAAFDNRRLLHGRDRFDPNTGFRCLHGCYVDRGEFDSRLRMLAGQERRQEAA